MAAVSTFVAVGALAASVASASAGSKAAGRAASAGREGAILGAMAAGRDAAAVRFEAEEAMRVGQENAERVLASARQVRSSQKVVAAASGFVADSGTQEVLTEETDNLARTDALAIMLDAGQRSAAGRIGAENLIQTGASQAAQYARQADNTASALNSQALGTLLGGLLGAAGDKSIQKGASKLATKVSTWGKLA